MQCTGKKNTGPDAIKHALPRARQDTDLNENLSRVFVDIEASARGSNCEDGFKGLFDGLDDNFQQTRLYGSPHR